MAMEVVKVYLEHFPALRFIGTRYTNEDRKDGGFGEQWGEWNAEKRFDSMKKAVGVAPYIEDTIGLMTMRSDTTGFTYWIGLFFPAGTNAPDGYDHLDLPESNIGAGWVRGSNASGEIFGAPPHEAVCKKLDDDGVGKFRNDVAGPGSDTYCFYERYNDERFGTEDENGNVILDYGNYFV